MKRSHRLPLPGRKICVKIPATTSNLGPGFDVLGLALTLYNELELEILPRTDADIVEIVGEGSQTLPQDKTNITVQAARSILPRSRLPYALRFRMINRIPLARGLGSSAAARLAGLLAADALCHGKNSAKKEACLLKACEMEGHPDNVVPAYYGGMCAAYQDGHSLHHFQVRVPKRLAALVCVPELELLTSKARAALPKKIPRGHAVWTASRVAFLIHAIEHGRFEDLKSAMQDVLHQPYRSRLIPGMDEVIEAGIGAGALGAALSGAGSSIFAFALRGPGRCRIGRAMQRAFSSQGIKSRYYSLEIDRRGACVKSCG